VNPVYWLAIAAVLIVVIVAAVLVVRSRGKALSPVEEPLRLAPSAPVKPEEAPELAAPAATAVESGTTTLDVPEAPASRLARLRRRLAGSQNALARGIADLLSRDRIDESTWDDFETTLITSDLGVGPATELTAKLR
jgi:fused signal recognition particle receptor